MEITAIEISGYKSIEHLYMPIEMHGKTKSYTTIFIGKNEVGKSNILDALAAPNDYKNKTPIQYLKIRNSQTEPNEVAISYWITFQNPEEYQNCIRENLELPEELLAQIKLKCCKMKFYVNNTLDHYESCFLYEFEPINFSEFRYCQVANSTQPNVQYKIKNVAAIPEAEQNSYKQIDDKQFRMIIKSGLQILIDSINIPTSTWKPKDEFLINEKTTLSEFAVDPDKYPILRNMFYLVGNKDNEQIKTKISELSNDVNGKIRTKLQTQLSQKTTQYLNNKWPEQKIIIEVQIESDLNLYVHVKDTCDNDNSFNMEDRSQGFKQFISLLLSMSLDYNAGHIKQQFILIDEPEIHLHPSGIRYLSKELLDIGKQNYLFVATHSNFMLDTATKDRHYLVDKDSHNLTQVKQIKDEESLLDDEVLKTAFGINVFRDFLSPSKILVEGLTDKMLLYKGITQINPNTNIIISNGKGDNLIAIASLMDFHDVNPIIIVDDDDEGQEIKKSVIDISNSYTNRNVYTIRDICGDLIKNGTIEDTLPIDFVQSKLDTVLNESKLSEIRLLDNSPICSQIKVSLQKQIDEKTTSKSEKKRLIDKVLYETKKQISGYDAKCITEEKSPLLYQLCNKIIELMAAE
jgi:predicted ATP-dependent endonuclease of OLD family